MLATLTRDHFSCNDWIYERKLDGERCLIFIAGNTVKLMSRNKKEINARYPEITGAFNTMSGDFVVDGEIVSFRDNVTSFSRLQKRMHSKEPDLTIPVFYYVFDMMHFYGYGLTHLPLRSCKSLLRSALKFDSSQIRYTPHRNDDDEAYFDEACEKH